MSGTYEIISQVPHDTKFACYVRFNEAIDSEFYSTGKYPNGGEYCECELPTTPEDSEGNPITLGQFITNTLQKTADDDAAHWEAVDAGVAKKAAIVIKDGQIVL